MYTLWRATIILGLFKTQSWDSCLKEQLDALPNLDLYDLLIPPLNAFEKKGTFPSCWVSLFKLLIFNSSLNIPPKNTVLRYISLALSLKIYLSILESWPGDSVVFAWLLFRSK